MSPHPHQLHTLVIGDEPAAWEAAGFALSGGRLRIANTVIHLGEPGEGRGIQLAAADAIDSEIDGMPFGSAESEPLASTHHPNYVIDFDHLVAMSPNMDRTTAALETRGLEHRRTRTFEAGGSTKRQAFFWLGDVILELAGEDEAQGEGPAVLWGLALTCADIDAAAEQLGEKMGAIKPAVQRGRRIATIRTRELGISVPIALMSPHPPDES